MFADGEAKYSTSEHKVSKRQTPEEQLNRFHFSLEQQQKIINFDIANELRRLIE